MADFLKINGVTVPVVADSWRETPIPIGETAARSITGALSRQESGRKHRYTFDVAVSPRSGMERLRRWLLGQHLSFPGVDALSSTGVLASSTGTVTYGPIGAPSKPAMIVTAGGSFRFNPSNKLFTEGGWTTSRGWSFFAQSNRLTAEGYGPTGWKDFLTKGAVTSSRGTANPVGVKQYLAGAPSSSLGCFMSHSSTLFALWGFNGSGTGVATDEFYSDVLLLPYELPDPGVIDRIGDQAIDWIPQVSAFRAANAIGAAPAVLAQSPWFDWRGDQLVMAEVVGVDQQYAAGNQFSTSYSVVLSEV